MAHGPIHSGFQTGDLPITVSTEGPSGERAIHDPHHEEWVWTYREVTIKNESDEHLAFHAWLVVDTSDSRGLRELKRTPTTSISLEPNEAKELPLEFRLDLFGFDEDQILNPGQPRELTFLEVGLKNRRLSIDYRAPDKRD